MKKYILLILILFTLISCKEKKKRNNEIKKITLCTGHCFGTCPIQYIEIDSSLLLKYYGEENAKRVGFYMGKISEVDWDTINIRFEKINYKELDTFYEESVDDPPTYLEIKYGNNIKKIRAQFASLPENVINTYYWLINFCNETKLEKTNVKTSFELEKLKYIYPPPPPPILKRKIAK